MFQREREEGGRLKNRKCVCVCTGTTINLSSMGKNGPTKKIIWESSREERRSHKTTTPRLKNELSPHFSEAALLFQTDSRVNRTIF
jgi:hypothetical protein